MSFRDDLSSDSSLETSGQWFTYKDEMRILLAHAGGSNKKFAKLYARLTKPHRMAMKAETLDEEVANSLMAEAVAKGLVLSWETKRKDPEDASDAGKWVPGIEQADKTLLPPTPENILKELKLSGSGPRLTSMLFNFALDYVNYQKANREEDAKNL